MGALAFTEAALAAWLIAAAPQAAEPEGAAAWGEVLSQGRHPWLPGGLTDVAADLAALVGAEPGGLVWFEGARPLPALFAAVDLLAGAGEEGLDPREYAAGLLAEKAMDAGRLTARDRALFDAAVSAELLRFLADVHRGRADPRRAGLAGPSARTAIDRARLLRAARDANRLEDLVLSLEPRYPGYARLKEALARYRSLEEEALPEVPPLPRTPVSPWGGADALRARLAAFGDLSPGEESGPPVGLPADLARGVERFQARLGLPVDGVLGRRTLVALNASPGTRARQIELAMERYRWLPDPGARALLVEVPGAELRALDLERGEEALSMRVVVGGSDEHQTPMFFGEVRAVVFHPYWTPPPRIVNEEILPRERSRPGWLAAHGMDIVVRGGGEGQALPPTADNLALVESGRLEIRQRPGPRNDLGLVKFVMPNPECIGLHGTPHRALFGRARRDRSHGCIRVEDPIALAAWVLAPERGWDLARIARALAKEEPVSVRLASPLSVLVLYGTASVEGDGRVSFREDLYGLDARLEEELRRPASGRDGFESVPPGPRGRGREPARPGGRTARRASARPASSAPRGWS
ncbi:MAG TPA: L,D-transpeptidase family protein [Anaeromyxobacteraceae bacterium]|nr:L,D-transpeptidase family protein [Anaeromyxobacteraceae bacterium]